MLLLFISNFFITYNYMYHRQVAEWIHF
jgi:hypothetical protein